MAQAKKKSVKKELVTNESDGMQLAVKVPLTVATIVEPQLSAKYDDIDIPEFLKHEGAFEKEAPVGFTPLISFGENQKAWTKGTWIIAKYVATREGIGPNLSDMYDFQITKDGKEFTDVSLWGSTIFDNKFRLLNPAPGKWIFIQYLGTTDTARKMNPAKDFKLAIVADRLVASMGYGAAK